MRPLSKISFKRLDSILLYNNKFKDDQLVFLSRLNISPEIIQTFLISFRNQYNNFDYNNTYNLGYLFKLKRMQNISSPIGTMNIKNKRITGLLRDRFPNTNKVTFFNSW